MISFSAQRGGLVAAHHGLWACQEPGLDHGTASRLMSESQCPSLWSGKARPTSQGITGLIALPIQHLTGRKCSVNYSLRCYSCCNNYCYRKGNFVPVENHIFLVLARLLLSTNYIQNPSSRDLSNSGIEPGSPAMQADSLLWATREALTNTQASVKHKLHVILGTEKE